jgi:predicted HTH transcriptional regulator
VLITGFFCCSDLCTGNGLLLSEIVSKYIQQLLRNGESQFLDYKQSITDAGKIAKTIAAFANGEGGTLLIGVKDNRRICGVRSEDEKYMIDLAGRFYCKPPIIPEIVEHEVDGKLVLESIIHPGDNPPYFAKDEDGKWVAYARIEDQTLRMGPVGLEAMKRHKSDKATVIQYQEEEKILLEFLTTYDQITLHQYQLIIQSKKWYATKILVNLVSTGIVNCCLTEKGEYFTLK